MKKIKIGINGFGRIGRTILRAYYKYPKKYKNLEIVAINDIADIKTLSHLFRYDSIMGSFDKKIEVNDENFIIDSHRIHFYQNKIEDIPWKKHDIQIVIESTGKFLKKKDGEIHLDSGSEKVIFSAPAKDEIDSTIVMGVNDHTLTPKDKLISNSSCTTNCLAPMVKVLDDAFGLKSAFMLTVHSYTKDQSILDGPHRDLRRARAAALSIVPTTTGATRAVEKVIPSLKGKLSGYAVRIPTPDVSLTDVTATLKKKVTVENINQVFKNASEDNLKGILQYIDEPMVSMDFIGNPFSSILDSLLTQVIGDQSENVRIVAWYDNEWGYSNRILELAQKISNI